MCSACAFSFFCRHLGFIAIDMNVRLMPNAFLCKPKPCVGTVSLLIARHFPLRRTYRSLPTQRFSKYQFGHVCFLLIVSQVLIQLDCLFFFFSLGFSTALSSLSTGMCISVNAGEVLQFCWNHTINNHLTSLYLQVVVRPTPIAK